MTRLTTGVGGVASGGATRTGTWAGAGASAVRGAGAGAVTGRSAAAVGCCVDVSNDGEGIAPEDEARVFDHGFRSRAPHVVKKFGLGLGLHIAKSAIEEDAAIYHVVKQIVIASLHGHPQPLVIEAARSGIAHHNQPSFSDVFDGMRAAR